MNNINRRGIFVLSSITLFLFFNFGICENQKLYQNLKMENNYSIITVFELFDNTTIYRVYKNITVTEAFNEYALNLPLGESTTWLSRDITLIYSNQTEVRTLVRPIVKSSIETSPPGKKVGIIADDVIYVSKVFKNSPAEKAGLKEGDIIFSFNNKPGTSSVEGLIQAVNVVKAREKYPIHILRNNKPLILYMSFDQ